MSEEKKTQETLAGVKVASRTHSQAVRTQKNVSTNVLQFPHHRRRGLLTLSELEEGWRSVREPKGDYMTPLPEDYIEGVRHG